jgi:hypothetical protein
VGFLVRKPIGYERTRQRLRITVIYKLQRVLAREQQHCGQTLYGRRAEAPSNSDTYGNPTLVFDINCFLF